MSSYLKKKIAFRFDVSKKIGFGHFMRCLSIAEKLNKKYSFQIFFLVNKNFSSSSLIKNKKFKIIKIKKHQVNFEEEKYIKKIIKDLKISVLFFDIKKNYSKNLTKNLNKMNVKVITIDDKYEKRIHSNVCFYPPVPQVKIMNWDYFKGKKFVGWEYIPLRTQFEKISKNTKFSKKILLLSGGTNYKNFINNILKKLNLFQKKLELDILLGFKVNFNSTLNKSIKKSHHKIKVIKYRYNILKNITTSSLVITPLGITAYEIASQEKFPIIFTNSKDDDTSASIFNKANIGYNVSSKMTFDENLFEKIIKNHQKFLANKKNKYSKYIRNGTGKIAKIINEN